MLLPSCSFIFLKHCHLGLFLTRMCHFCSNLLLGSSLCSPRILGRVASKGCVVHLYFFLKLFSALLPANNQLSAHPCSAAEASSISVHKNMAPTAGPAGPQWFPVMRCGEGNWNSMLGGLARPTAAFRGNLAILVSPWCGFVQWRAAKSHCVAMGVIHGVDAHAQPILAGQAK